MHRTNVIPAATATGVIVGLGAVARLSPAFKAAATDISITLLVVLILVSLLGSLIAPLLDWWSDPGPERPDGRSVNPRELSRAPHAGYNP